MIKEHLHLRLPANIDAPLWHYTDINKLRSILEHNALYFCRADLLGDDHEGSTTTPTIEYRKTFYQGATPHFIEHGVVEMAELWTKCTYISCWHNSKNESRDMWKLYAKDKSGVAIKTSISRLKKGILDRESEFCLGFVQYLDYDNDYVSEANAFLPFFYKRDMFMHEREFRIMTSKLDDIGGVQAGTKVPKKGLFIPIDIKTVIEKIVIAPTANTKAIDSVKTLLNKHDMLSRLCTSLTLRRPTF